MSANVNIWLGEQTLEIDDVQKRFELSLDDTEIREYLNEIKFVVNIHATKASLRHMLNDSVAIQYAKGGVVDFDNLSDGLTTDHSNVFVVQLKNGYTFNPDATTEVIGRMPCTLDGDFIQNVNPGSHPVDIRDGFLNTIAAEKTMPLFKDTSGNIISTADLSATYSVTNSSDYNDGCLVSSALPRCLSSQMEGFKNDESLLKIVTNPAQFFNLFALPLQGLKDASSNTVSLQNLMRSNVSVKNSKLTLSEIYQEMNDRQTANPGKKDLGKYIIGSIFNNEPPVSNTTINTLWNVIDSEDEDNKNDLLILNNTTYLKNTYTLQFVLKTHLNLISSTDHTKILNRTAASPGIGTHPMDKVEILYNLIFDRGDAGSPTIIQGTEQTNFELDGSTNMILDGNVNLTF